MKEIKSSERVDFYFYIFKICDSWKITKVNRETCIACFFKKNEWFGEPYIYIPHDVSIRIIDSVLDSSERKGKKHDMDQ